MVYFPSEDSFLLENELKVYLKKIKNKTSLKVLDMGAGSGIQAKTCLNFGIRKENLLAADIDEESIKLLKKQGINSIRSNLFSNIKTKFDLIIFNAPYLPENKYDKRKDTTAGKRGNETILKFLKQAKNYLEKGGVILLLFSSLSKPEEILKYSGQQGYKSRLFTKKSVGMMETLFVYQFYWYIQV